MVIPFKGKESGLILGKYYDYLLVKVSHFKLFHF